MEFDGNANEVPYHAYYESVKVSAVALFEAPKDVGSNDKERKDAYVGSDYNCLAVGMIDLDLPKIDDE